MFCYFIIMLVAGLGAYHYVFNPLINDAVLSGSKNTFTQDPAVSVAVLTALSAIIAPITLVVLLVPAIRAQVKASLEVLFNE